jgi:hypothetical protein
VHCFDLEITVDDRVVLATDAVAEWVLAHPDAAAWLAGAPAPQIAAATRRMIGSGAMARDDVGVLRVRATATPRAPRARFATLRGRSHG